ncbi:MAG: alpha/beta hydrolase [Planctomycetota bacterium]|nr:alpha/beta hydrolase [Planctomycetota bacterium]
MAEREDAGFLITPGGPLYCFRHHPAGDAPGGAPVVVFATSLMEERKCAYGALTLLARELARRGAAAVRFDYRRTGESPCADVRPGGGYAAFDRLSELEEDLAAVCSAAREWQPGRPLAVVGLRMGAAIALRAAAGISGISAIAAIAPVVSGAAQARQWRQRSLIRATFSEPRPTGSGGPGSKAGRVSAPLPGVAPPTWGDPPPGNDSGSAASGGAMPRDAGGAGRAASAAAQEGGAGKTIDLDGYLVSRAFLSEVESADLMKCDVPADIRVLLLQVSHRTTPAPEIEALAARLGPRCRLVCRRLEPFWDRIDDVDVSPLAGDLAEFLLAPG